MTFSIMTLNKIYIVTFSINQLNCDTQHNETQHNDPRHNDTQHNETQRTDTQHVGLNCEIHHKSHLETGHNDSLHRIHLI